MYGGMKIFYLNRYMENVLINDMYCIAAFICTWYPLKLNAYVIKHGKIGKFQIFFD